MPFHEALHARICVRLNKEGDLDTEFWPTREKSTTLCRIPPFHIITSCASRYSFGAAALLLMCWCSAVAMSALLLRRRMLARVVARVWPTWTISFDAAG